MHISVAQPLRIFIGQTTGYLLRFFLQNKLTYLYGINMIYVTVG